MIIYVLFLDCDFKYYGLSCFFVCSINCIDNVCNNNGYCINECKMGIYGDMC